MRVFVTGATGVLGSELVPRLVQAGHQVEGAARSEGGAGRLEAAGARPVEVDLFQPASLKRAVEGHEAVFNLATALPPLSRMSRRSAWEMNDRLRTEGAANLVEASISTGVGVFVQPSISMVYADGGSDWIDEDWPVDPPFQAIESALDAEASTHRFSSGGGRGVVLRLARLYGPGAASAELVAMLRHGRGVVVGDGSNFVSSLHAVDAGRALLAALDLPSGTYNVADDRPLTSLELTGTLADAVGGRPPRRIPTWAARPLLGGAVRLLTVSHRVSNARFRQASGWSPLHPDLLDGARSLT